MKQILLTSGLLLALCQTVAAADEKQTKPPEKKPVVSFQGQEMQAISPNQGVTTCTTDKPCMDKAAAHRTKVALALLYLGIRNRCGQQACKLHVTTVTQK